MTASIPELRHKVEALESRVELLEDQLSASLDLVARPPGDPESSIVKCRVVLERLLKQLHARHGVPLPEGRTLDLATLLANRDLTKHFPDRIRVRMDAVRQFGNLGAHDRGPVTVADALACLASMVEILEWHADGQPRRPGVAGTPSRDRARPMLPRWALPSALALMTCIAVGLAVLLLRRETATAHPLPSSPSVAAAPATAAGVEPPGLLPAEPLPSPSSAPAADAGGRRPEAPPPATVEPSGEVAAARVEGDLAAAPPLASPEVAPAPDAPAEDTWSERLARLDGLATECRELLATAYTTARDVPTPVVSIAVNVLDGDRPSAHARGTHGGGETDAWHPLVDGEDLSRADAVRIEIAGRDETYFYVLWIDSGGFGSWVYPKNDSTWTSQGFNPVMPGTRRTLPSADDTFDLGGREGIDHLFVVATSQPWPELENLLARAAGTESTVRMPLKLGIRGRPAIGAGDAAVARQDTGDLRLEGIGGVVVVERWFHHVR